MGGTHSNKLTDEWLTDTQTDFLGDMRAESDTRTYQKLDIIILRIKSL